MASIIARPNTEVLIDEEDFDLVNSMAWYVRKPHPRSKEYVYCRRKVDGKDRSTPLHRFVLNLGLNDQKRTVDHINGNTLDNRKSNLRICTISENLRNLKLRKTNKSGYKGVNYHKHQKKWASRICINRKRIHLGYFTNEVDAAKAYDEASKKYHGEFGSLNFP